MKGNFWKNKKVLVTGYDGFLGAHLTKKLLEFEAKIVGIDIAKKKTYPILKNLQKKVETIKGDVAHLTLVNKIIEKYRPEIIFHLAAQAIVGEAVNIPIRTFKSNIEGTWNILEACKRKKFIEGVVVASSDKAYGEHKLLPYKEETPLRGIYPYDVSKSCADLLANTYFKTYSIPVCVTRCGNIFGPGDLHFSRIIPDAMRSIIKNKRFVIRSDGRFTRDYIYVEDVVRGYILLAEKMKKFKLSGQSFNFSNERPLTVLELFKKITEVSGRYNLKPRVLNRVKYEIKHQYLSSKKARKMLGWKPECVLEEGLIKTLQWYRDYFNSK